MRALAVLAAALLAGCSTMMNNGTQSMTVTPSEGEDIDATVTTLSGSYRTSLPTTVTAEPSHQGVQVEVTDAQYEGDTVEIGKSVDGFFFANIIWFGAFPIGMLVDAANGTMWDYDNQIVVPVRTQSD